MGNNLITVFIIAAVCFFFFRLLSKPKTDEKNTQQPGEAPSSVHERAKRAWGMLEDDSPAEKKLQTRASEEEDFLAGAKAMYSRIKQSFEDRDFDDLAGFCTEKALTELRRKVQSEPRSARNQILLIEASVMERQTETGDEKISVLYEVMQKTSGRSQSQKIREIWVFSRPEETPQAMWLFDGTLPVN